MIVVNLKVLAQGFDRLKSMLKSALFSEAYRVFFLNRETDTKK